MMKKYTYTTNNKSEFLNVLQAQDLALFIFELTHNAFRRWDEREDIDITTLEKVQDKINELLDGFQINIDD